jgi:phosphoribosylaminoimidazole carboxylase (NCAIR synthetase)
MNKDFPTLGILNDGWISRELANAGIRLGVRARIYCEELVDSISLSQFIDQCDLLTYSGVQVSDSFVRTLMAKAHIVRPGPEVKNFGDLADSDFHILVARSPHGQAATWSLMRVIHCGEGIMLSTVASGSELAQRLALDYAQEVKLVGVASLGLTVSAGRASLISAEIGPTVWGAWSKDGARTDQFEQHIRALFDLPLGDTQLNFDQVVTGYFAGKPGANLYRPYLHLMARNPDLKFVQYGTDVEGYRGHVSAHGKNLLDLYGTVEHALDYMNGVIDE